MRPVMSAWLFLIVFLLPHFALAGHPPCLHSQEVSELEAAASPIERLNLLRIYSRATVGKLVVELATYRPMQEGYPTRVGIDRTESEELKELLKHSQVEIGRTESEELKQLLQYWLAVKSSYWCVMLTSIHEVRELGGVEEEAKCFLEEMHDETQSFVPRIRKARENVEVYKELQQRMLSAIEATEDLAAEIRDALARGAHPATGG